MTASDGLVTLNQSTELIFMVTLSRVMVYCLSRSTVLVRMFKITLRSIKGMIQYKPGYRTLAKRPSRKTMVRWYSCEMRKPLKSKKQKMKIATISKKVMKI